MDQFRCQMVFGKSHDKEIVSIITVDTSTPKPTLARTKKKTKTRLLCTENAWSNINGMARFHSLWHVHSFCFQQRKVFWWIYVLFWKKSRKYVYCQFKMRNCIANKRKIRIITKIRMLLCILIACIVRFLVLFRCWLHWTVIIAVFSLVLTQIHIFTC